MAAHALQFPSAAPHLKLVVSRPAAVWPAAPPLATPEPAMSATMKRCLLLALLLHVWLVLTLGSAPGGTAAPGQGVAGTLNITLQGPDTPGATEVSAPPLPAPAEGARGSATQPRWGGVVREQAVAVQAAPGAAQLGRWAATPQPAEAPEVPPAPPGRVVEERAQPAPTAVLRATPPALQPASPSIAPPLEALVPEPSVQAVPLVAVPIAVPLVAVPLAAPMAVPLAVPMAVPIAAPVVMAAPAEPSAPAAESLPPTLPERRLATPATRTVPNLGAALPSAPAAPAAPAVLPGAAPLPVPETITPRLQRPTRPAAADLSALAPAATVAAPLAAVPDVPPLPVVGTAVPTASALQPSTRTAQPATVPAPVAAAVPVPMALPAAVTAAGQAPASTRLPDLPAAAFKPGAPDAGSRLGTDVATPPSAAASVPPRLNLQLSRPRGGELSRGGSTGALPLLPRPPDIDEKLGSDIAKSAKQDCKDAYRGAGLLAVVPLAVQALKADGACKW